METPIREKVECPICKKLISATYLKKHMNSSVHQEKSHFPSCDEHTEMNWNCKICKYKYMSKLKTVQERKICEICHISVPDYSFSRHELSVQHNSNLIRINKIEKKAKGTKIEKDIKQVNE